MKPTKINVQHKGKRMAACELFIKEIIARTNEGYVISGPITQASQGFGTYAVNMVLDMAMAPVGAPSKLDTLIGKAMESPEVKEEYEKLETEFQQIAGEVEEQLVQMTIPPKPEKEEMNIEEAAQEIPLLTPKERLELLTKKAPMLAWMKENGVELDEIPNNASALKKILLAKIDELA